MSPTRSLPIVDQRDRPLKDLRISVTDRCNFRCSYCMPKDVFGPGFEFLPKSQVLSFEELTRLASLFVQLGVKKIRLTGGEPLLRSQLTELVRMLSELGTDLAMTTNGSLLRRYAQDLKAAGLKRVTVSLDSLEDEVFTRMNDVDFPVAKVLDGIDAAAEAGLSVKVNCVIRKGVNDHTFVDLAKHFQGSGHTLRFIEFMDVGLTNGWRMQDVISEQEILERLNRFKELVPLPPRYGGEVARRYGYADGRGEIGVIGSVTRPFCAQCTRARISANGQLFTCLFGANGVDLRAKLRDGSTDEDVKAVIQSTWQARQDAYSERRSANTRGIKKVEMSYIGG